MTEQDAKKQLASKLEEARATYQERREAAVQRDGVYSAYDLALALNLYNEATTAAHNEYDAAKLLDSRLGEARATYDEQQRAVDYVTEVNDIMDDLDSWLNVEECSPKTECEVKEQLSLIHI